MGRGRLQALVAAFAILAAVSLAACGGSDDSTTTAKQHDDSGSGSGQFRAKGGDNSIQNFGEEVEGDEFAAAAAALHGFLDARVAGDWEAACSHMDKSMLESVGQLTEKSDQLKGVGCPEVFEALTEGVPQAGLEAAAVADVGSFRVEGDRGFLLYFGAEDTSFAIPMARENGTWKVAALAATPLN